jgi:hypothetical protein
MYPTSHRRAMFQFIHKDDLQSDIPIIATKPVFEIKELTDTIKKKVRLVAQDINEYMKRKK